jgi:hypothetical protein
LSDLCGLSFCRCWYPLLVGIFPGMPLMFRVGSDRWSVADSVSVFSHISMRALELPRN